MQKFVTDDFQLKNNNTQIICEEKLATSPEKKPIKNEADESISQKEMSTFTLKPWNFFTLEDNLILLYINNF